MTTATWSDEGCPICGWHVRVFGRCVQDFSHLPPPSLNPDKPGLIDFRPHNLTFRPSPGHVTPPPVWPRGTSSIVML